MHLVAPLFLCALLSLLLPALSSAISGGDLFRTLASSQCTSAPVPGTPASESFCLLPPTFPVRLYQYQGTWFQIYGSGSALRFGGECTTANYGLLRGGGLSVLNCDAEGPGLPQCVEAVGLPRNDTQQAGTLALDFAGTSAGGNYNVAAVLEHPSLGYIGAAVYSCEVIRGEQVNGYFILSRTTEYAPIVLALLKRELVCRGFDVDVEFVPTRIEGCSYFFDEGGYELRRGFSSEGGSE